MVAGIANAIMVGMVLLIIAFMVFYIIKV